MKKIFKILLIFLLSILVIHSVLVGWLYVRNSAIAKLRGLTPPVTLPAPDHSTNIGIHMDNNAAIKAFFGLRSSFVTLASLPPQATNDIWYVFTIGKFENGKFLGYEAIEGGVRVPSAHEGGELELLWGKKDGKMGYVTTWPLGAGDFHEDTFFEDISYFSSGGQTGMPIIEKYDGFEIDAFAAVPPAGRLMNPHRQPISPLEGNFMANIAQFPKVVLLLYREFPSRDEYLKWIGTHKEHTAIPNSP